MNYLVSGDTHRTPLYDRLSWLERHGYKPEDTGLIILGDVGINFFGGKPDKFFKRNIENSGYTIFCVRGNHDLPPENLDNTTKIKREEGIFWYEPEYPHILYFQDGGVYWFGEYRTLVLGGAHSIDRGERLLRAGLVDENTMYNEDFIYRLPYDECAKAGWFKDETLLPDVLNYVIDSYEGANFDIILSHTCPIEYLPTDLFLDSVLQNKVDRSVEIGLSEVAECVHWRNWLFGHFHEDRIEAPGVYLMYESILPLDEIVKDTKNHFDKLLPRGPRYNRYALEI